MVRSKGARRPKPWQAKARRGRAKAVIFQPLLGRGAPAETGWGENLFDSPLRALIHWRIPYLATCSLFLPLQPLLASSSSSSSSFAFLRIPSSSFDSSPVPLAASSALPRLSASIPPLSLRVVERPSCSPGTSTAASSSFSLRLPVLRHKLQGILRRASLTPSYSTTFSLYLHPPLSHRAYLTTFRIYSRPRVYPLVFHRFPERVTT